MTSRGDLRKEARKRLVRFHFPGTAWPREPQQMSPEIREIEWMVCDWETGRVEVGYFGSRSRERERDNGGESLAGAQLCVRDECLISVLPMRGAQTKWMFPYFIRAEATHRLYWAVRAGRW